MQHAGENENDGARTLLAPASTDKWIVNVSTHELIDRLIPGAPVDAHAGTVPPFGVELAVAELHNFSQGIEK